MLGPMPIFLILLLLAGFSQLVLGANSVQGIRIWDSPEGTRIVLDLKKKARYKAFQLEAPNRIVIDLSQVRFVAKLPKIKSSHRLVKNLRSATRKNKSRRFVVDTVGKLTYRVFSLAPNKKYGHRLVIALSAKSKAKIIPQPVPMGATAPRSKPSHQHTEKPTRVQNQIRKQARKESQKSRKLPLTDIIIAIDAGHGGEDPGALGFHGSKEKDITLIIAKKLKKTIDKQHGMRGVLIRKADYFVSLRNRIDIARKAEANMFVSIHADAFHNRRVKGSSVYVLSEQGATDEATKWLEDQENSADLIGGISLDNKDKNLAFFLLDLAQTATIEASIRVASHVLSEIRKIAPVHKPTVQHARFVVLKSPDIPSLLVETAFISNPSEEKKLKSNRYQNKLVSAILKGVIRYFKNSPLRNRKLAEKSSKFSPVFMSMEKEARFIVMASGK